MKCSKKVLINGNKLLTDVAYTWNMQEKTAQLKIEDQKETSSARLPKKENQSTRDSFASTSKDKVYEKLLHKQAKSHNWIEWNILEKTCLDLKDI